MSRDGWLLEVVELNAPMGKELTEWSLFLPVKTGLSQ
jgi:hypothetical protein|tara:strand:+ start:469 stop:579 length:111 start_codon:yes stop_codon:yes gene_type:complete